MWPRACNFLLALLQIQETCWSKLSSELIKIPSKVSFVLVVSETSPIDTSVGVLELKRKWCFPELALRWLYWNWNWNFKIEQCGTLCSIVAHTITNVAHYWTMWHTMFYSRSLTKAFFHFGTMGPIAQTGKNHVNRQVTLHNCTF